MQRRYLVRSRLSIFATMLICPAVASAQAPAEPDLPANAAVQYWQAFGLMPALDDEQQQVLENWQTVPLDDPAAKRLIDASQPSLMYLRRGVKLARCDWGLDYGDGISMHLPHLSKARDLAKLAALNARRSFETGNRKAAREDARAMMVLARHVGRDPIMICVLVRYLIEGLTIDLLAPQIPEVKASHEFALAQFQSLPPAPSVQETILVEKRVFAEWIIKELRAVEEQQPGSWKKLWNNLLGAEAPDSLKQIGTFEDAIGLLKKITPVYDELSKVMALPRQEFDVRYPEFKRKVEAANALAAVLLPAVDKLRATEDRNQARLALLMAAMAVAESGPEALEGIQDPFGDGPFEYRALERGFELRSKLRHEGEPVTLTAGGAARG